MNDKSLPYRCVKSPTSSQSQPLLTLSLKKERKKTPDCQWEKSQYVQNRCHKPTSELTVTMPIFYVQCTGLPSLNQQSWAHGKREE